MTYTLHLGDCRDILATLPAASVDAIVCDPPAGIGFMGKSWDNHKGGRDQWIEWMQGIAAECLRVTKPGSHALVWAIPRTSHWTATAWENAGWEVRDRLAHLFATGFPKSLDVSKAIDRAAGAEREVVGAKQAGMGSGKTFGMLQAEGDNLAALRSIPLTAPATDAARQWEGWGTALKPAVEDWWLLRAPLQGTVAATVQKFGTGALNIAACRVGTDAIETGIRAGSGLGSFTDDGANRKHREPTTVIHAGRWPANLTLGCACDGPHDRECAVAMLDAASGESTSMGGSGPASLEWKGDGATVDFIHAASGGFGDTGGASRFFFQAKSSRREREAGLDDLPGLTPGELTGRKDGAAGTAHPRAGAGRAQTADYGDGFRDGPGSPDRGTRPDYVYKSPARRNGHPTVKPVDLMRWLCRLITPPGGTILDPFLGSGSTGMAALDEGFSFIGIEQDAHYLEIARYRIEHRHVIAPKVSAPREDVPQGRLL